MSYLSKIETKARYWYDAVERRFLVKQVSKYDKNAHILDFGCGRGRWLGELRNKGYNHLTGIDKNEQNRIYVKNQGYEALKDLTELEGCYFEVILLSHIVEHFEYYELKCLIDKLSRHLKNGGLFLIFTPTVNKKFFFDFDHVKPYPPPALLSIFGIGRDIPVQFEVEKKWFIDDIIFKKRWFSFDHQSSLYKGKNGIFQYINYLLFGIHIITFRYVGYTDSYCIAIKKTL